MKIKKFNEAIVDWETENIKEFYKECLEHITTDSPLIEFDKIKEIGEKHDIEVVNYDTFLSELPNEKMKKDAPKKGEIEFFGLVNPVTHKARLVIQIPALSKGGLDILYHMLKHENIHVGQKNRKVDKSKGEYLGDIKKLKDYFSNKDEIMAFSQSISDMLLSNSPLLRNPYTPKPKNIKDALKGINSNQLWRAIKSNVDDKTLKRYKKYIYLYLQKEFEK